ncbi:hypothetical protein [Croceicoccus bisphenolivorans]|uniref:hypothetical protein n=1 Tax=Croceicoccus bisphenolivorans TaxID=1783232 RepID=UPI000832D5ED|nr:hypothetical protein [Croceicoccus bisphenolivorans]
MTLAAYIASCLLLAAAFVRLGVLPRTRKMLTGLNAAMAIVRDPAMDDLAKEKAVQQASVKLLGGTLLTTVLLALAFAVAAVPALAGAWSGAFSLEDFVVFSLRPDVLAMTIATFAALGFALRRVRKPA